MKNNKFMKFLACMLLVVFMVGATNVMSFAAVYGDIDGNGKVNSADARKLLRVAAKLDKLDKTTDEWGGVFGDFNNDGKVTAADARIILRVAAKLEKLTVPTNALLENPIKIEGSGDKVLTSFNLPEGKYRMICKHTGSSNFIIHDEVEYKKLLINEIGNYEGATVIDGGDKKLVSVQADGDWEITIENLGTANNYVMNGTGAYVSGIFNGDGEKRAVEFIHDGDRNFIVYLYEVNGKYPSLLVNEIGEYSGEKVVSTEKGAKYFWVIMADGDWNIK